MRFVRQGELECYLARCAMLGDVSLAHVREVADQVARELGLSGYAEVFQPHVSRGTWLRIAEVICARVRAPWRPLLTELIVGGHPPRLPPGRGEIEVAGPGWAHIVVYEDGIVYDPEMDEPLPYDQWLEAITQEPGVAVAVAPLEPSVESATDTVPCPFCHRERMHEEGGHPDCPIPCYRGRVSGFDSTGWPVACSPEQQARVDRWLEAKWAAGPDTPTTTS